MASWALPETTQTLQRATRKGRERRQVEAILTRKREVRHGCTMLEARHTLVGLTARGAR